MGGHNRSNAQRQRLAYEAARIMVEQGIQQFDRARRKAAVRAGIGNKRCWPNNEEIQEALLQQRRLFQGDRQALELRSLRRQALSAMRTFASFVPRLVGPVLCGTGDAAQGVRLHLFADNPEDVVLALLDQGIPWQEREGIIRYSGGVRRNHPVFTVFAGETPFELVVLPLAALRNPPLNPVSERPEKGADAADVERLVESVMEEHSVRG
ncbi:MAG: hypothetical protein U9Q81_25355 [Pseudomonadota bacterium]|nr:hypothetical protein [Pseudomonadota bacterium]